MLTFPTQAEQAVARYAQRTKTLAFHRVAKEFDAFRDRSEAVPTWCFPDGTTVTCEGHGRAYRVEAHLP